MYDKELAYELICLIIDNIETVRKELLVLNLHMILQLQSPA